MPLRFIPFSGFLLPVERRDENDVTMKIASIISSRLWSIFPKRKNEQAETERGTFYRKGGRVVARDFLSLAAASFFSPRFNFKRVYVHIHDGWTGVETVALMIRPTRLRESSPPPASPLHLKSSRALSGNTSIRAHPPNFLRA